LCWWTDVRVFDSWTSSEGSGIVDDSSTVMLWNSLMGPSGIGASLGSSAATMLGEGGVTVNDSGEGDVMVGDSGEGAVIIGDLGEGDVMISNWGKGDVTVSNWGEGDVTVGNWGDASPPTNIDMTSSRVSDSGHSSPRKRPCG